VVGRAVGLAHASGPLALIGRDCPVTRLLVGLRWGRGHHGQGDAESEQ
jgi:hypothetical protein